MPGPCNSKKKRKQQAEKEKAKRMRNLLQEVLNTRQSEPANTNSNDIGEHKTHSPPHPSSHSLDPPPPDNPPDHSESNYIPNDSTPLQRPFIHNPGNGPRVSDMSAYLASFFVPPPAFDDLLCATLTARAYDVIGMLEGALSLPREVALVSVGFPVVAK